MYMKRIFIGIIPIIMLFWGCSSTPTETRTVGNEGKTLDQAIAEAVIRIEAETQTGTKVALLNFTSPSDRFSLYVLDELTANLMETKKLIVVDRREIDLIRSEFDFQFSGEVGDDSIQELGRMLGAQSIVTGSLTEIGGDYRIVIRVLNVQSAAITVHYRSDVTNDRRVQALLEGGRSSGTTNNQQRSSNVQTTTVQNPVQTPQLPRQISEEDLIGVWKGSYRAGQGDTALVLTVYKENNRYMAIFDFFNLPGRSNSGEGKYYMSVEYSRSREKFYLKGVTWIDRPNIPGWTYNFADLEGTITGDIFSGFLTGSNYAFRVVRDRTGTY